MWQKCPICDGEGRVTSNGVSSSVHQMCPVCKGAKIISELNGLPAQQSVPTVSKMEKVQTAVEWLKQQYIQRGDTLPSGVFEEAKQMEKGQIVNAFDCDGSPQPGEKWISNGEQYYNETYSQ